MGNFQLPKPTAIDLNGDVLGGAKLYFYETGTSTPLTVYQDEDNNTAHANPVVADSAGRFAPIYLQSDKTYKVVLDDSDDNTIYTVDPVKGFGLVDTDLGDRLKQVASNPLDYGAVGDGVADESSEVQSAINNATGTVDLLGKTYRCDSSLTIGTGKRLINGTLDFSNCTAARLIQLTGGSIGSAENLTSNVIVGDQVLDMGDTSGFSSGDWLLLADNDVWYSGIPNGEVVRVRTVDSGTQITLTSKTISSYTTAQTANVKKINTVKDVEFSSLRITAAHTASTQRGIELQYGENVRLRGVRVDGAFTSGATLQTCIGCSIEESQVTDCTSSSAGHCIEIKDASKDISVNGCNFDRCMTGVVVGGSSNGVNRGISVSGCKINGPEVSGVSLNAAAHHIDITGNNIICDDTASGDGILNRATSVNISGNRVRYAQRDGIRCDTLRTKTLTTDAGDTPASSSEPRHFSITGNDVALCAGNGVYVQSNSASGIPIYGIRVNNNSIFSCGGYGVWLDGSAQHFKMTEVCNNAIDGTAMKTAIRIEAGASGTVEHILISGNIIAAIKNTEDCISLLSGGGTLNKITVNGNTIRHGKHGIYADNISECTISGNRLDDNNEDGVHIDAASGACSNVSVLSNQVIGAGERGIYITASSANMFKISVSGNSIDSPANEGIRVLVSATRLLENLKVNDNSIASVPSTHDCIRIEADSLNDLVHGSVSGNTTDDGQRGILLSVCRYFSCTGNTVINGDSEGIFVLDSSETSVCGNTVIGSGNNGIVLNTSNYGAVSGNLVSLVTGRGVIIDTSLRCSVTGNTIRDSSSHAINITDSNETSVGSNTVYSPAGAGVLATDCAQINITGNTLGAAGSDAIKINKTTGADTEGFAVIGNNISNPSGNGIYFLNDDDDEMTCICISGNNFNGISGSTSRAIQISASSTGGYTGVSVVGNNCYEIADSNALRIDGASANLVFANISGNLLRTEDATQSVFFLNMPTTVCNASGNIMIGGDYAVNETTTISNVAVSANYMYNQATGATNGTFTYAGEIAIGSANNGHLPNLVD